MSGDGARNAREDERVPAAGGRGAAAPLVSSTRRALVYAGLFLGMLTAGRIALRLLHPEDFDALGAGDLLFALVRGLQFDASITLALIGVPLVVTTWPFGWARRAIVQRICGWWCWAATCW